MDLVQLSDDWYSFAMACLDFTVFCADVNRSFDLEVAETQLDMESWKIPEIGAQSI